MLRDISDRALSELAEHGFDQWMQREEERYAIRRAVREFAFTGAVKSPPRVRLSWVAPRGKAGRA